MRRYAPLKTAGESVFPDVRFPQDALPVKIRNDAAVPEPAVAFSLGEERKELIEVTDGKDRPIACLPPELVLRQGLFFRMVTVVLRTRDNKVLLRKRTAGPLGFCGCWDGYTDFVRVGESRMDAAVRLLPHPLGLRSFSLSRVQAVTERHEPVFAQKRRREHPRKSPEKLAMAHLSLFTTNFPVAFSPARTAGEGHAFLEVDKDELHGLIREVPELFTRELVWATRTGMLFRVS